MAVLAAVNYQLAWATVGRPAWVMRAATWALGLGSLFVNEWCEAPNPCLVAIVGASMIHMTWCVGTAAFSTAAHCYPGCMDSGCRAA
jgi:hypothetical protein